MRQPQTIEDVAGSGVSLECMMLRDQMGWQHEARDDFDDYKLAFLSFLTTMCAGMILYFLGTPLWLIVVLAIAFWSAVIKLAMRYTERGQMWRNFRDVRARIVTHEKRCQEFNARLEAVQDYADLPNAKQPELGVLIKFAEESAELAAISDEIEKLRLSRVRDLALAKMTDKMLKAPNQGVYRSTKDVSDLVYANTEKLRVGNEELDEMLADEPPAFDDPETLQARRLRVPEDR